MPANLTVDDSCSLSRRLFVSTPRYTHVTPVFVFYSLCLHRTCTEKRWPGPVRPSPTSKIASQHSTFGYTSASKHLKVLPGADSCQTPAQQSRRKKKKNTPPPAAEPSRSSGDRPYKLDPSSPIAVLSVGPSLGAALSTRPVFATPRRLQRIVPYSFNHFQSLSLGTSTLSSLLSRILIIIIAVLLLARQLLPLALVSALSYSYCF